VGVQTKKTLCGGGGGGGERKLGAVPGWGFRKKKAGWGGGGGGSGAREFGAVSCLGIQKRNKQLTLNRGVLAGDDFNSCASVKAGRCLLAENALLFERKLRKE